MFDGSGRPFAPGIIAQMQLREWSPKKSAPLYAAGYVAAGVEREIALITEPFAVEQLSPVTTWFAWL